MKRIALILLLLASAVKAQDYPEYWKLPFFYEGSYGGVTFPQARMWFNKDSTTYYGIFHGSADSLGGNPWTAYLRSDVKDTFTILQGDTVSAQKYKLGDSTFAYFTAGNKRVTKTDTNNVNITNGSFYYAGGTIMGDGFVRKGNGTFYTGTVFNNATAYYDLYSGNIARARFFGNTDSLALGTSSTATSWYINATTIRGIANSKASADTLYANKQIKLLGTDTTTLRHSGDTLHIETTASWVHFNKNVKVDSTLSGSTFYGELWAHNDTGVTVDMAVQDSFYRFAGFRQGLYRGFTLDSTNGRMIATQNSVYNIRYHATGSGQNNHVYHIAIYVNNVQKEQTLTHMLAASGDIHSMNGGGFINIAAGDTIDFRIADHTGTGTGKAYSYSFDAKRISGL